MCPFFIRRQLVHLELRALSQIQNVKVETLFLTWPRHKKTQHMMMDRRALCMKFPKSWPWSRYEGPSSLTLPALSESHSR
jgi:hypothetical protein